MTNPAMTQSIFPLKHINPQSYIQRISDHSESSTTRDQNINNDISIGTTPNKYELILENIDINTHQIQPLFCNSIYKEIICIHDENRRKQDTKQPMSIINEKIIETLNSWYAFLVYILALLYVNNVCRVFIKDCELLLFIVFQRDSIFKVSSTKRNSSYYRGIFNVDMSRWCYSGVTV